MCAGPGKNHLSGLAAVIDRIDEQEIAADIVRSEGEAR